MNTNNDTRPLTDKEREQQTELSRLFDLMDTTQRAQVIFYAQGIVDRSMIAGA